MRESDSLGWGARAAISAAGFLFGLVSVLWWQQRQDAQRLNEMETIAPAGAGTPAEQHRSNDEDIP